MGSDPWRVARTDAYRIGNHLERIRRTANLSLRELNIATGIDHAKLCRIEHGTAIPTTGEAQILRDWVLQHDHSNEPSPFAPAHPNLPVPPWAHARLTDPESSERTVHSIAQDTNITDAILNYARHPDVHWFTDTMLTEEVSRVLRYPVQRNVVARARGLIERAGDLVRLDTPAPATCHPRGRRLLRFTHKNKT